jgi:hypothetical protein
MKQKREDDKFSPEESQQRFEDALRAGLMTPHKTLKQYSFNIC